MSVAEIQRAEEDVQRSSEDLERALGHLEDRLDASSKSAQAEIEKAQETIAKIRRPVDRVHQFVDSTRSASVHYLHRAQEVARDLSFQAEQSSRQAVRRIRAASSPFAQRAREHPALFALGVAAAAAVAVGILTTVYLGRRRAYAASARSASKKLGFSNQL